MSRDIIMPCTARLIRIGKKMILLFYRIMSCTITYVRHNTILTEYIEYQHINGHLMVIPCTCKNGAQKKRNPIYLYDEDRDTFLEKYMHELVLQVQYRLKQGYAVVHIPRKLFHMVPELRDDWTYANPEKRLPESVEYLSLKYSMPD